MCFFGLAGVFRVGLYVLQYALQYCSVGFTPQPNVAGMPCCKIFMIVIDSQKQY